MKTPFKKYISYLYFNTMTIIFAQDAGGFSSTPGQSKTMKASCLNINYFFVEQEMIIVDYSVSLNLSRRQSHESNCIVYNKTTAT